MSEQKAVYNHSGSTPPATHNLAITTAELDVLNMIVRHANKHQSDVFYDLDTQWPVFIGLQDKVKGMIIRRGKSDV